MPVTFNSNNNYNVEIITEPDTLSLVNPSIHGAPVAIKYSSTNNTPYIELKITADAYQYPLIAGNMNFDGLSRFIDHNAQDNVNNSCGPITTPHGVNTTNTFEVTNFPGTLPNGSVCTLQPITVNVTSSFQGPFESHRSSGQILNDQIATGVAWTKVIWVEVYQDDNGQMINTQFSPENNENLASWQLWNPNNSNTPITNNVYPEYIRAFVFLEFAPAGPSGLTSDVNIFIDIDEDEPVYGCTDSNADNYDSTATIDDGSCSYPASYQISLDFSIAASNPGLTIGPYTDGSTYNYSVTNLSGVTFNYSYTTVDYEDIAPTTGNLVFTGSATQQKVTLNGSYSPGDTVSEIVEIYVYPTAFPMGSGLRIYDFPGAGGPSATQNLISPNAPNYSAEIQRMYYGWGNTKNNLTAASLRIQEIYPVVNNITTGTNVYHDPTYIDPSNVNFSPAYSLWHVGDDPTGLRPTQEVNFGAFYYSGTSNIAAQEQYQSINSNPARDYFPNRIKIIIPLNFTAPAIPGTIGPSGPINSDTFFNLNNTEYTIPVKLAHITENQGDLNWS